MATKITYGNDTIIKFNQVKYNEIFNYNQLIFIRTIGTLKENDNAFFNAICLNNGIPKYFEETDEVRKVDVEIKVNFI